MKTEYEIYLRTWAHMNKNAKEDLDYETVEFEPCINYRDAVNTAKRLSRDVPFMYRGQEIVQIQIAAYIADEEERLGTTYYLLWKETYENGKKTERYSCE